MILKIDTKNKTVEIEGSVTFKELHDQLKAMFPVTYLDFKITCRWINPSAKYNSTLVGTINSSPYDVLKGNQTTSIL